MPLLYEIAIYLVFPQIGLLGSHLQMLAAIRAAGISPVVVSNLPLSDADRTALGGAAYRIIERPNIGYDFGGYRDAMLEIADLLPDLRRVWLLNDSVWLMPTTANWFDQARALGKDFTAPTSSFSILRKTVFGARRFDVADCRSIRWVHSPANPNFHYASYALSIGPAILQNPAFMADWRKLDIRNDKKQTVRRGEIGLSQWVLKHGFSHGATHEIDRLDQELALLPDDLLRQTAEELVVFRNTRAAEVKQRVLASDPAQPAARADMIGMILTIVARQSSAYALAIYNHRHNGFPFLKKSPLWLSAEGPDRILRYLATLDDPVGAVVAQEAEAICVARSAGSGAKTGG